MHGGVQSLWLNKGEVDSLLPSQPLKALNMILRHTGDMLEGTLCVMWKGQRIYQLTHIC